ncbi:ATP synthase mitochondrial F1 complex assembly factor 2-like isoform X2 [Anneissia japonica]|uniref:ATP synthase mitochondrial F1 complex assembly factor 2-like isoform X2 n=1 Tax=Anneissia japonica TaxID=1529436 RepID=UPI0014255EF4|nr:ATP synthase mitochondrial F1 complex assembly factor 2-like isoform X2 [Anneissia japonica]
MINERKKFYKDVSVTQSEGVYEINLDRRKLKTPSGKVFQVPSEALAIAVCTEWDKQTDKIQQHTMQLTTLCNAALDNPTGRSKQQVITSILHFLDTDTVCYRQDLPVDLVELQTNEWDPLLEWFNNRYDTDVTSTMSILPPTIPEDTRSKLQHHLMTHNDWALLGYESAVQSLKSLVVAFALMDRHIHVERAMALSRLEEQFQISKWGEVEWGHRIDHMDLQARVAAATLFVHLVTETAHIIKKIAV